MITAQTSLRIVRTIAWHSGLLAATAFALYPITWVLTWAVDASANPVPAAWAWPSNPTLARFLELATGPAPRAWLNSVLVSVGTAAVAVALAAPAAYGMSRFDFLGKRTTERTMLVTQMLPGVASSIPLFLLVDALGLIDTHLGLVLVYATSAVPFALFQLRGAFDSIPKDYEEAAMVDGASRARAFWTVVLPAARPALAVTGLFAFMTAWNEYILAATFLTTETQYTMPILLAQHVGQYQSDWGAFATGAIVVSVPVMALFYTLQRHLVGGLTAGGIK